MPSRTTCPDCGAAFQLPDNLQGKKVRCPKCKETFTAPRLQDPRDIPLADDDLYGRPSRRPGDKRPTAASERRTVRRRDDDDDEEQAQSGSSPPWLLIGGAGAGGVLTLLVVVLLVWRAMQPPNAAGPEVPGPLAGQNPPPQPGNNPPVNPQPAVNPADGGQPAPGPAAGWKLAPDPAKDPLAAVAPVSIPLPGFDEVVYPTTPSAFVVLGYINGKPSLLWDLAAGKKVGELPGTVGLLGPTVLLSPEGTYLAGKSFPSTNATDVWSFATGQMVRKLDMVEPLDFSGPGQIMTKKNNDPRGPLFQIWDIETGNILREFAVPGFFFDRMSMALSPGRKYLTVVVQGRLTVIELATGTAVGSLDLPRAPIGFLTCEGLSFSPDGTELTGLFNDTGTTRLITIDLAKGDIAANFDLGKGFKTSLKNQFGFQKRAVEWLPNRSGWLIAGQVLLDRESGGQIGTIPVDLGCINPGPRKVLDKTHVLVINKQGFNRKLETLELAGDKLETAAKITRAGGDPGATSTKTVPVTPADWSKVRTLTRAPGAVAWAVAADAAPKTAGKVGSRPIELPGGQGIEVQRILFGGPQVGQAVVLSMGSGKVAGAARKLRVDQIDLATGTAKGSMADIDEEKTANLAVKAPDGLPNPSPEKTPIVIADVNPDGTALVVKDLKDPRRVDVYDIAGGRHVVGWLPYETDKAAPQVAWVGFLDAQRILTANAGGAVTLWELPACRAVYTIKEGYKGPFALSPTRKHLAAFNGATFDLLDAATGAVRGQVAAPAAENHGATVVAFQPAGAELAALFQADIGIPAPAGAAPVSGQGAALLVRWNLSSGEVLSEFAVPPERAPAAEWCGSRIMLLGNQHLLDLEQKAVVWRYLPLGPGLAHATGSPDGRHWFSKRVGTAPQPYLTAMALPDENASRGLKLVKSPQAKLSLKPGTAVSVKLELTGTIPDSEDFRARLVEQVGNRLKAYGITVSPGQAIVLTIRAQEGPTPETLDLHSLMPRVGKGRENFKVPVKKLTCQVSLSDARGLLWKIDNTFKMGIFGILHLKDGEEPGPVLLKNTWTSFAAWAATVQTPTLAGRQGATPFVLPGDSMLAGSR
jgi:predicted Zn finger-like uncharacterized protein